MPYKDNHYLYPKQVFDVTDILRASAETDNFMSRILKNLKSESYVPENKEVLAVNRAMVDDLVSKYGQ